MPNLKKSQDELENLARNSTFTQLVAAINNAAAEFLFNSVTNSKASSNDVTALFLIVELAEIITIKKAMISDPKKYEEMKQEILDIKKMSDEIKSIFNKDKDED